MKTQIYNLHRDHTRWLSNLRFYSDDLRVMRNRLQEINAKNNSHDFRKQLEHFQNQLIVQEKNVMTLQRLIREAENKVQAEIRSNPVASDHRLLEYENTESDNIAAFERIFSNLRREFNSFAARFL